MFSNEEIGSICLNYNIECFEIGEVIDTSFDENDRRYNYQINDKYFLKISNLKGKTEDYLYDIEQLVRNYKSIGVYCPSLYKTKEKMYSLNIEKDEIRYICHLEEKSPFKISDSRDEVDYEFKKEVLGHVGILASKFTNYSLSSNKSMWSLIELAIGDTDIDEKQENFDDLIKCLKEKSFFELADQLTCMNEISREKIKRYMRILPRCVYQGDLNNSNIVVDEDNQFRGIIDFNMFGTEVNINCFLNESMYYLKRQDFEELQGKEIYTKMTNIQNDLLTVITSVYKLNNDELEIMNDYNKIIFTSFYPNVSLMINLLNNNEESEKVINLLETILIQ